MTDQHIYSNNVGDPLLILRSDDLGNGIMLNQGYIELEIPDPIAAHGVRLALDTYKLLELIDAAAPDAMRAYLRETADAEALDAIPEADSPEDVDEHPDILEDDELLKTPTGRLLLVQRIAHLYPKDSPAEHLVVADWIIDLEPEHVEALTLSGEDLNR